jgi:hypothetical protein
MYRTLRDVIQDYQEAAMHYGILDGDLLPEDEVWRICQTFTPRYEDLPHTVIDALLEATTGRPVVD